MKDVLAAALAAILLLTGVLGAAPEAAAAAEQAAVEKIIRANIGWAMTKDRPLLESTMVHDGRLFIFNPDSEATRGWEQFVKNFDFWLDPRFKATGLDIRDLRIDFSPAGDAAWWSCILDDLYEWDGKAGAWKDTRWTGVLEKRDGKWRIVQMHFSFASDKVAAAVKEKLAGESALPPAAKKEQVMEVKFAEPPAADSDEARTLKSMVKVRDIGEQYATGGLYLITHYGDREGLFQKENQKMMDRPWINETWRFCSAFSTRHGNSVTAGHNWDNQNVGSIIVSLYKPSKGHASVSFSRAIDLGFPLNLDLMEIIESPWAERLLLTPFYATGGMNDCGLVIEFPGVKQTTVKPISGKESIFAMFLIRKILDQAKDVDEAVSLADKYLPFDIEKNSVNAHLFIADAAGKSVVLEYGQDRWEKIYSDKAWQVLTNKPVYNVPDTKLRKQCWRYKSLAEALDGAKGNVDWRAGLKMLQDVSQKGTTWSVAYSLPNKELHFSIYQKWDTIFHLKPF